MENSKFDLFHFRCESAMSAQTFLHSAWEQEGTLSDDIWSQYVLKSMIFALKCLMNHSMYCWKVMHLVRFGASYSTCDAVSKGCFAILLISVIWYISASSPMWFKDCNLEIYACEVYITQSKLTLVIKTHLDLGRICSSRRKVAIFCHRYLFQWKCVFLAFFAEKLVGP